MKHTILALTALLLAPPAALYGEEHLIQPGESPQAVIDRAIPGDRLIFVPGLHQHAPGKYRALLYVDKSVEIEAQEGATLRRLATHLLGSPFKFTRHGESGLAFSEVLPGIAKHADDIAIVRSMFTEHRNHEQAIWMANTGLTVSGRPNIGSWVAFGLGADNQNLPAYVSLPDPGGMPVDGARNWSSGWLPPSIRELRFAQKECLCCTFSRSWREPPGLITGEWNSCGNLTHDTNRLDQANWNWMPASPALNSPHACSFLPQMRSISTRRPRRFRNSMAWIRIRHVRMVSVV